MAEIQTLDEILANRRALSAALDRRQAIIRDNVRSVVHRYATGFYLYGRPGTGKTRTVRRVLAEEGEVHVYQRGHLTPIGLFELLADNPAEVVVLDDVGSVFKSPVALPILLAALEHPDPGDRTRTRVVRYRRRGREDRVQFQGGVVCASNVELHQGDVLDAFKSRVTVLRYDPTDAQLAALMLDVADGGPAGLPPPAAGEVARHVIAESLRVGCRLDLRVFVDKALPSWQQWTDNEAETHWRDLVTAAVEEQLVDAAPADPGPTRAERKAGERVLVREIVAGHPAREDRVREWVKRTGKSERAFYRRLAEPQ
ncbi:MAG: hypothetical protein K2X87_18115 [Gemmataceae bacterium]|nr:hypothetical protein [Gemmataceae bacterium]